MNLTRSPWGHRRRAVLRRCDESPYAWRARQRRRGDTDEPFPHAENLTVSPGRFGGELPFPNALICSLDNAGARHNDGGVRRRWLATPTFTAAGRMSIP